VREGQVLAVVESMKMEFPVVAPVSGRVCQLQARPGMGVAAGQRLTAIVPTPCES
jgi:urea carboxylase